LANALPDERLLLINENFIKRFLRFYGLKSVDGFWLIWVSSHQFDVLKGVFLLDLTN
jgi:16S rRNA (cytosine1402-N4)-methyltransferase